LPTFLLSFSLFRSRILCTSSFSHEVNKCV
jgi:hypothetical protein